ncbi:RNA polymerase sigma factor [Croceibacterium selenioxidans]|nr:sigma-70 family RNA polymerase sigma factor [Croceibacterium selenioxidans]
MNGKTARAEQDARYLVAARTHGAMIERLAHGYEFDADLRRDLVQEIHAALWRSFAIFEGQCAEKSWVHRIAHNVGVTHMMTGRRKRRLPLVGLEQIAEFPGSDDPEHSTGERTLSDRLLATIHRLEPADRQVMLLYLEDLTAAEIGEVTGLSASAVAVRIHRLKALLAEPYRAQEKRA